MFFDKPHVVAKIGDAKRKFLSKAGAFIRISMRRLIRRRRRPATPGSPPSSHEGTLRDLIFFGYDDRLQSVVVGPSIDRASKRHKPTVPNLLEFGGAVDGKHYAKFPFARPAIEQNIDKFPGLFANSVKG